MRRLPSSPQTDRVSTQKSQEDVQERDGKQHAELYYSSVALEGNKCHRLLLVKSGRLSLSFLCACQIRMSPKISFIPKQQFRLPAEKTSSSKMMMMILRDWHTNGKNPLSISSANQVESLDDNGDTTTTRRRQRGTRQRPVLMRY